MGRISHQRAYWGVMTSRTTPRRHLATSPFAPRVDPPVERYSVDDRVSHDAYGLGRVTGVEAAAVTVDFGSQKVRITSPFAGMELL
jgi:hypothetical protein